MHHQNKSHVRNVDCWKSLNAWIDLEILLHAVRTTIMQFSNANATVRRERESQLNNLTIISYARMSYW